MDHLWLSNLALDRRFPDGVEPFKMVARLAEECGELAAEVHHWEAQGIKREKHGAPDPQKTAKEVLDVMRAALRIATHYGLEEALLAAAEHAVAAAEAQGLLTHDEVLRGRPKPG